MKASGKDQDASDAPGPRIQFADIAAAPSDAPYPIDMDHVARENQWQQEAAVLRNSRKCGFESWMDYVASRPLQWNFCSCGFVCCVLRTPSGAEPPPSAVGHAF